MERKEFIKKFVVGGSILFTAPVLFNSCSDDDIENMVEEEENNGNAIDVDLSSASSVNLQNVGGFIYINNIIVIRTSSSNYIALSKVCTHQSFDVSYDHANSRITCTSGHGSIFNLNGSVANGPADSALKVYQVTLNDNKLTIS